MDASASVSLDKQFSESRQHQTLSEPISIVFAKVIVAKNLSNQVKLDMIEHDNFFDEVFMKYKIRMPKADCLEQIKLLFGVQLGIKQKETYILVNKLERVLFDLGYIYVNIAKLLKDPNHEAK